MGRLCFWRDWEERPDREVGVQGGAGFEERTRRALHRLASRHTWSIHKHMHRVGHVAAGPEKRLITDSWESAARGLMPPASTGAHSPDRGQEDPAPHHVSCLLSSQDSRWLPAE